jgi:hypothetical protein
VNLLRALGWTILVWGVGLAVVFTLVAYDDKWTQNGGGVLWLVTTVLAAGVAAWRHYALDGLAWFMLIVLGPLGCLIALWRGANRRDKAQAAAVSGP